ncbi:MAG: response regulator [Gammaproteobacteria bacterium]|jgi:two-component system, OmpR family, response regulator QseB
MRILIAEDDPLLGEGLSMGLRQMGYTVDWVSDGLAAERALQSEEDSIDALILDLGLPKRDGLTLLDRLRRSGSSLPVLILTARDTVEERISGLDRGADDYVVKPFDLMEVSARLRAITRRREGRSSPQIEYGPLVLDQASRAVSLRGESIALSSQEMAVLEALLSNTGRILTRQQLESSLYGWEEGAESNALEVYIHHLRKKLGKTLIRTVRGIGYTIPDKWQDDGR